MVCTLLPLSRCRFLKTLVDESRAAYDAAALDPDVVSKAPDVLQEAEANLRRSEQLLSDGADPEEVEHYAYLAKQRVAIAQETARLKSAEASIEQAETERKEVQLQARRAEAERAREEANVSRLEAERRTTEAEASRDLAERRADETQLAREPTEQALARAQELANRIAELEAEQTARGLVLTLAELVGIVLRGGMRYPARQIEEMHFGAGTPFETVLRAEPPQPSRVLSPEVAATVRRALTDVVEQGTAVRAKAVVTLSDGTILPIGGKTGTGDNRHNQFGSRGHLLGSQALNRTATFVFFIGDRFFGVVTAFVDGPEADDYQFTSSLPTQVLKMLGPTLRPLFDEPPVAYSAQQVVFQAPFRRRGVPTLQPSAPGPRLLVVLAKRS